MTQYQPIPPNTNTVLNYRGQIPLTEYTPIASHKRKFIQYKNLAIEGCKYLESVNDWVSITDLVKYMHKVCDYWISTTVIRNIVYELYQWEVISMRDILINPLYRTGKRTVKDRLVKLSDNWEGNLKLFLSVD